MVTVETQNAVDALEAAVLDIHTTFENDSDPLPEELTKLFIERESVSAPFRTDPEAPHKDEKGKYIPQILSEEERQKVATIEVPEKIFSCLEAKPSLKAWKNFSLLFNLLTEQSSRLAVDYQRGASQKDLARYTHRFHLVNDNMIELLELLAPLRRGDCWSCTVYGDILCHTPFASRNVFGDPNYRKRVHEEEAMAKIAYIKALEKETKGKGQSVKLGYRVAELELAIKAFKDLGDIRIG